MLENLENLEETENKDDLFVLKRPKLSQKRIMFLDTETTGLPKRINGHFDLYKNLKSYENSRLIELAYVIITIDNEGNECNENISKTYSSLITPSDFKISVESINIHGITEEMCSKNGKSLTNVLEELYNDINGVDIIVGHNVEFDVSIILSEYYRLHKKCLFETQKQFICTVALSYNIYGKYLKLCDIYKIVFDETFNAHRALDDVHACKKLYMYLKTI